MTQFIFFSSPWLLPAVMLVVLGLSIELPYRFARSLVSHALVKDDAWNTTHAGLLTLAAFIVGLSFAQASARFDGRRALVVNEANAIGTTWLRADQLQATAARRFRRILTDYTAARLEAYKSLGDPVLVRNAIAQSVRDQAALWSIASSALRAHQNNLGLSLLMQTLNDTIDVSTEQRQALRGHVPTATVVLMLALVTLGTLATGLRFARDASRPAILSAIFVVASVVVISMVIDYDRPQTGLVTVDLNPIRLQLQSMQQSP
ncbi:MAG: hypothetical protein ABSD52_01435 [Candidatus Cybelea sp.]|jgi:hypothetical protein